ncbi:FxSxx-COOH system tetratricopeptide repeat protein [Streptomyces sp. NPDC000410]|uniref:FxSxx-COOH system tetratricopeptide repeat protein n=1 Tax=Streptomyces sp. NPDC000410 TaxID=3154254 RepID=UPI00332CFAC0
MTGEPSPPGAPQSGHGRDGPFRAFGDERLPLTELYSWEVADALWIAAHHPWLTGHEPAPQHDQGPEPSPLPPLPPPPPAPAGDGPAPAAEAPAPVPAGEQNAPDQADHHSADAPPPSPLPPLAPSPARPGASPVHPTRPVPHAEPPSEDLSYGLGLGLPRDVGTHALGRALRPLRTYRKSAHELVLDEPATAERIALAPQLPPALMPAAERRWEAVLVVDTAPHMAVWRPAVERFRSVLRLHGGFRDVEVLSLDTDGPTAVLRSAGSGSHGRPRSPRSQVDPSGRRIVFVVTDGVGPAWRSGAAQRLTALWGKRQPVVILQTLPQRLWHRTGVFPAQVRLRATGPWSANGQIRWEPAEPMAAALLPADEARHIVPVPVLEMTPAWLGPWAGFVAGATPRWADLPAVLTSARPRTAPLSAPGATAAASAAPGSAAAASATSAAPGSGSQATRPPAAAERVARFRTWASQDAFALATRLAAIQLDLPTMAEIQRQTMPHSGVTHLAELLISGLVKPLPDCGGHSYLFHEGVREELLAAGSREATELALRKAAEFLAPSSGAARELLGYFSAGTDAAGAIEISADELRFREAEHAALQALSGPHLRRARRLGEHIEFHAKSDSHTVPEAGNEMKPSNVGKTSTPPPDERLAPADRTPHPDHPAPPEHTDQFPGRLITQVTGQTYEPNSATPRQGGTYVTTVPAAAEHPAQQQPAAGGKRPASPAVWGNMPPRNLVFTGREELLVNLENGLRHGPTAVLPHALHGMGGVGKSQLALEYVYRHAAEYDVIWWIPAERPTQIQQAFVELARRLHLPVSLEAITAVPAVLEALRTGIPYGNWLLVFDNAESPSAVQEYFPSTTPGGPVGSVIVTSRNPQWNTLAQPLEVDVFERDESIQLLRRRNPDLTTDEADMLAEVLGDLPLAVEQASAWRAETGMPPAEYLRVFEEKRAELMAVSPPTQYEETVATAWNVSLDHIEGKNAGALQLLQLCAYFAPEPISRQFFSTAAGEPIAPELDRVFTDPIRLSRAIREINRYSLAKIDHRTNSIQMHRLVQAVLEARMTEEQRVRFRNGAHLLLAANAPNDPRTPQNWARFGELYPHVIVSQAPRSAHRNVRQMVYNVAEYLFYWGDHDAALDFADQTYETWRELFGEDDMQTLVLGRHLRFVRWRMGRYAEAAELGERMLATLEEAGPDVEEEYLRVKGQVSADRRVQGDFRGALEFDEDVYQRAVRAYGDEDPETLLHAHNLGVCLRVNGDFRRALELDEATWRRKIQTYGADDLTSLASEASVALDRQELGEYAQAETLLDAAVDNYKEKFGDTHPATLQAIARLGVAQRKAGHHQAAEASTRIARDALTERYGELSPDARQTSLNLSIDLRQNGDLQEALRLGERCRSLYAETLGRDHPHTIAADVNTAVTLRLLDRVDTARKINESALFRLRESLGETHPFTLVSSVNLGNDLFAQGDAAAALELDRETLRLVVETMGEDHPTALVLRGNLASDLRALGQAQEAAEAHAAAVEGIRQKLGDEHPAHADALAWRRANCDIDLMPL